MCGISCDCFCSLKAEGVSCRALPSLSLYSHFLPPQSLRCRPTFRDGVNAAPGIFFFPLRRRAKPREELPLKKLKKEKKNETPVCKSRFLSDPPAVLSHTCQHFFPSSLRFSLYLCIRLLSAFCSHWLCPHSTCGNNRNPPYLYLRACPSPTVASWEMQSFTLGCKRQSRLE